MKTSPLLPLARHTTAALGCSLAVLLGSGTAWSAKLEASGSQTTTTTTTTTTEPAAPSSEPPPSETPPTSEPPPALDVAAPPTGDEAAPDVYAAAPPPTEPVAEPEPDAEPAGAVPTPFDQGRLRVGVSAGYAQAMTTSWFVVGGGVGYFVLKGLEAHVDGTFWLGGSPFIATITPGVRYVVHMLPEIKPYIGTFYRHYFVDAIGYDSDSIGGRAGINFMINPNAYVGGGVIVEQMINNNLFTNDTQVYPEITIAFAF